MTTFSHLSDDELADDLITWAGRVAAGEAELLVRIGEFDRREAWAGPGLLSCAHWLSWRTGLGPVAAREHVRVARALTELPVITDALRAGRISYSQVRAITRVATAGDQERWIDIARCSTAGQLERVVRGVRRACKPVEDAADPELAAWRMRMTKSFDDDGNAVYRIVLPAEQGAVLDVAIEAVRAELDRAAAAEAAAPVARDDGDGLGPEVWQDLAASAEAGSPQPVSPPAAAAGTTAGASAEARSPQPLRPRATAAEALLSIARASLSVATSGSSAAARRARSNLVAQVDPLTGWGRLRDGEVLPPSSLKTVLTSLPGRGGMVRLRPLTAADLRVNDLGRSQRHPSAALRDLLGTLDGECCRFPGCTRRRKLHAHHVRTWSAGGPTDLDNLVLLCSRHHVLVHARGFVLELHGDRRLDVATAEGVEVLHLPALPWRPAAELDPQRRVTAATLPPHHVRGRIDLEYAVVVLAQQSA